MSASFEWDVRASESEGVRKGRERERMGDRFRVAKGDNNFLSLLYLGNCKRQIQSLTFVVISPNPA